MRSSAEHMLYIRPLNEHGHILDHLRGASQISHHKTKGGKLDLAAHLRAKKGYRYCSRGANFLKCCVALPK